MTIILVLMQWIRECCIIDAGHYGVEHIFMEDVKAYLEKVLTGVHMDCVAVKHPFVVI